MMRLFLIILIIAILFGCSSKLQARVGSFHALTSDYSGATFAVIPFDWQKGSLEFDTYAQQIVSELKAKEFELLSIDKAQYAVFLGYWIDSGSDVVFSYPIIGETGITSATTFGTARSYGNRTTYSGTTTYSPSYGVVGSGVGTRREYTRRIRLEILEKEALLDGRVRKIYEGEVVSVGSTGQLSAVMPTLIHALFQHFPGESGQSKMVTLSVK